MPDTPSIQPPNPMAAGAAALILLAEFGQVVASTPVSSLMAPYLLLHIAFVGVFGFQMWRPVRGTRLDGSLAIQAGLASAILLLNPEIGTVAALFVLLSWQAARASSGPQLWIWLSVLSGLIALPFMMFLGPLNGMARALMPIAGCFIVGSYLNVARKLEADQRARLRLLEELQHTHQQLREYATQAGDIVASEERDRLAGELRLTVMPTLERIATTAHALRVDLDSDDALSVHALHDLQTLTRSALTEMRRLITFLSPGADATP